jgi:methylated-DNA-[protein]-cysteine S-methyltransferase
VAVNDVSSGQASAVGFTLLPWCPAGEARARSIGGRCAVAFGPEGLLGVLLPGPDDATTIAALCAAVAARRPDVPALVEGRACGQTADDVAILAQHLRTGDAPLTSIRLDPRGLSAFRVRVGQAARAIPPGQVRTYGELARAVGSVARAVGRAMATNPFAVVVPCHRVVAAHGPGGFSAPGGLATKDALLRLEGHAQLLRAPLAASAQGELFADGAMADGRRRSG